MARKVGLRSSCEAQAQVDEGCYGYCQVQDSWRIDRRLSLNQIGSQAEYAYGHFCDPVEPQRRLKSRLELGSTDQHSDEREPGNEANAR